MTNSEEITKDSNDRKKALLTSKSGGPTYIISDMKNPEIINIARNIIMGS